MSLFTGLTSSTDTPILHLTNTTNTVSEMDSDVPISSTVFHSSMQIVQLEKHVNIVESITIGYVTPNSGTIDIMKLSDAFIAAIINKPIIYLFYKNRLIATGGSRNALGVTPRSILYSYQLGTDNFTAYPDATYNYAVFNVGFDAIHYERITVTPAERAAVVPSDFTCYVTNLTETQFLDTTDSTGIVINDTDVIVRGVDIGNTPYLSTKRLNLSDVQVTTQTWSPLGLLEVNNMELYIIDPSLMASGIKFSADYIKKGGEFIIDKSNSPTNIEYNTIYSTTVGSNSTIFMETLYDACPVHTFSTGDMFAVTKLRAVYGGSGVSSDSNIQCIFAYKEGWITTVFHVIDKDSKSLADVYYNLKGVSGKLKLIAMTEADGDTADFSLAINIMVFN